jgi:hypothetical protein
MLPVNTYNAEILSGVTSKSSKGSPQLVVQLSIVYAAGNDGQWHPLPTPEQQRLYISLTDKAKQYAEPKLKALGFNGDFANPQFSESNVNVSISHEDYKGKTQEKIELADFSGGGEPDPADEGTVMNLNSWWKAKNAQAPVPPGKPSSPPAAPTPPPPGEGYGPTSGDDVPF